MNEVEMKLQAFQINRGKFSVAELLPYQDQWVAFSSDGTRIVASAEDLADLDALIVAAGEDPELVGLEKIQFENVNLGGGELS